MSFQHVPGDTSIVLGLFPHGTYPMGQLLLWTLADHLDHTRRVVGMAHTNMFRIPFYKHLWIWMGGIPVTKENILSCLRQPATIVTVIVGGMVEMFHQFPDREEVGDRLFGPSATVY